MREVQRRLVADHRGEREVLVAGEVQQQPGDARAAAVGLFVPSLGGHQVDDRAEEPATQVGVGIEQPGLEVHRPEPYCAPPPSGRRTMHD